MFETKILEKIKTHILFSITFSRKSRLFSDNVDSMEELDRPNENIIWRMRFACWISSPTNTHSEFVILIAFPWQQ